MFVDFAQVKENVSFTDAIQYLDLAMKKAGNQWRGSCPACNGGERSLVLTEGRGFYCFDNKAGGDVIALAAHIKGLKTKEAAQWLAEQAGIVQVHSTSTPRSKVPVSQPESEQGFKPLAYLEPEHEAVIAIGFDPEVAKTLGIGYAPRGILRGTVAVPVRDEHGVLKGYIGIESALLPADFQTNVVPFKKQA